MTKSELLKIETFRKEIISNLEYKEKIYNEIKDTTLNETIAETRGYMLAYAIVLDKIDYLLKS